MGISFVRFKKNLVLEYVPDFAVDSVRKKLEDGTLYLKRTFSLSVNEQISIPRENSSIDEFDYDEEGYFAFSIAEVCLIDGIEFYKLNKKVFGLDNNIFFDVGIPIEKKLFIAVDNISIISRIDDLLNTDIYITYEDNISMDSECNIIPYSVFLSLVAQFPNTYELKRYASARISDVLRNYVSGISKNRQKYEQLLSKRLKTYHITTHCAKEYKKLIFEDAADTLREMLDKVEVYGEKDWQEGIQQIICTIYPEYILSLREVNIGTDSHHSKIPDFLLVTASGNVDVLEIKKPDSVKVITSSVYRNNYVADKDLEGAIVQIEKYLYTLNRHIDDVERKLTESCKEKLTKDFKFRIVSPQGILLMGRSVGLNEQQLEDFELIKRQFKNIVDILTYDDLMMRIDSILKQLEDKSI